ncbi:MAG: macro domain-containing protein [Planctomycetota bacterium]|jgi:O-acetyl-ADP-ribose deacetylase (regulator of RNase III)
MAQPEVVVGDITTLKVDAIVNAANNRLAPGGGVCGAIHRAAGPELAWECRHLAPCETGDARITGGHELPARHVIHAVGPVYQGGSSDEVRQLALCYERSLELAHKRELESIAFPCISTGVFGYPREEAAKIALEVIGRWLATGRVPTRIICCCFSEEDAEVYRRQLGVGS